MRWECNRRKEDRNEKWNRAQMKPRRAFAWGRVELTSGICIWLESYWVVCKEGNYGREWIEPRYFLDHPDSLRDCKRRWLYSRLTVEEYSENLDLLVDALLDSKE